MKKKIDPLYYENTDFSEYMSKNRDKARAYKLKRITINIPPDIYETALQLNQEYGIGYQNLLKVAMRLGLNQLIGKKEKN
jgi:hypothetical protein